MTSSKKKLLIGWGISLILFVIVAIKIDWETFLVTISRVRFLPLILSIGIYLVGFVFRGLRTKILLPSLNFFDSISGVFIGYAANNILPARLGEIVRAHIIGRKCNLPRSTTLSNIIVERIFDGFAIVILLFIGSEGLQLNDEARYVRLAGILVFGLGLFVVILSGLKADMIRRYLPNIPFRDLSLRLLSGIEIACRDWTTIITVIVLSFTVWFIESLMFLVIGNAFHLDLTVMNCLFTLGIVNLAALVPSSPGNIGVFQASTVFALSLIGINHSEAFAYSVVTHFCQIIPVVVCGLLLMPYMGITSIKQLSEEEK